MARSRFAALVPLRTPETAACKYSPEYCNQVRMLAQEGMFPEEWCAHIGVTLQTLYNWANAYPEFEEAVHIAWWILRAYWSKKARESVQGIGMAPSVLNNILEKRFPDTWGRNARMTHEHLETRNTGPQEDDDTSPEALRKMSDDDLEARIAQIEARRKHEEEL